MFMQNFGVTNKRALWYVMVFSGVVNCHIQWIQIYQVSSVMHLLKEWGL